jgi:hypothetical protein
MRALLGDAAGLEHDDAIGMDHGRQAVRDDDRGAAALDRFQRRLDIGLGAAVERAGRLVEDQDRRVLDQGARDRDALLLAARELQAALADAGVEAVGERLDEAGDRGAARGGGDLVGNPAPSRPYAML